MPASPSSAPVRRPAGAVIRYVADPELLPEGMARDAAALRRADGRLAFLTDEQGRLSTPKRWAWPPARALTVPGAVVAPGSVAAGVGGILAHTNAVATPACVGMLAGGMALLAGWVVKMLTEEQAYDAAYVAAAVPVPMTEPNGALARLDWRLNPHLPTWTQQSPTWQKLDAQTTAAAELESRRLLIDRARLDEVARSLAELDATLPPPAPAALPQAPSRPRFRDRRRAATPRLVPRPEEVAADLRREEVARQRAAAAEVAADLDARDGRVQAFWAEVRRLDELPSWASPAALTPDLLPTLQEVQLEANLQRLTTLHTAAIRARLSEDAAALPA